MREVNDFHRDLVVSVAKVACRLDLTLEALETLGASVFEDVEHRRIRTVLTRGVMTIGEREIRYPANWWQAVRERFLPAWWLSRWPVQYVRTKTWQHVCPHHVITDPGVHVNWLQSMEAGPCAKSR